MAAVGAWIAAEGPSPGLAASTLGAPVFVGGLALAVGAIRLNEGDRNHVGDARIEALATATANLQTALWITAVGLALGLLLHALGIVRARQHGVRISHPSGLLTAGLVLLFLARELWSLTHLVGGWAGPETLTDPVVGQHTLALLFICTLGIVLCAVMAPASLVLGVFIRRTT